MPRGANISFLFSVHPEYTSRKVYCMLKTVSNNRAVTILTRVKHGYSRKDKFYDSLFDVVLKLKFK